MPKRNGKEESDWVVAVRKEVSSPYSLNRPSYDPFVISYFVDRKIEGLKKEIERELLERIELKHLRDQKKILIFLIRTAIVTLGTIVATSVATFYLFGAKKERAIFCHGDPLLIRDLARHLSILSEKASRKDPYEIFPARMCSRSVLSRT